MMILLCHYSDDDNDGESEIVEGLGETAKLNVGMNGTLQLWNHNDGEKIVADYSTEYGSLPLHSVDLDPDEVVQFVENNGVHNEESQDEPCPAALAAAMLADERETEMAAADNNELPVECTGVSSSQTETELVAVPLASFGEHVEKYHANANEKFAQEYKVQRIYVY